LGVKLKRGDNVLAIFQVRRMLIATSIKSSHRDLLNYMVEHGPIGKNNQNTYNPVLASPL